MKKATHIMVTYEFGNPVYIAPMNGKLSGINVTPNRGDAEKWDERDLSPNKLDYYKTISGYKELKFESI